MSPVLLVAVGGVAGALVRAGVAEVVPHEPGTWGWSTIAVNALGAAVLTALLARRPDRRWRLLVGTGAIGGFTTFSGFAVDAVLLADAGRPALAGAYVLVSVVTLLAAGLAGARSVRR
ncbi:MAG: Camphor resistance CrcB protein [Frankiales bacterium]|nr:Camphor resistance CrcB protein [Frankiales bacterium]